MKVLVTGGCGFIGSHVVDRLLEKGHEPIIIHRPTCGSKNINNKNVKMYDCDIREISKLDNVIKEVDSIIHMAAMINVDQSIQDPWIFWDVNVKGTAEVLEIVRKYKKRIIYFSSCEVYGNIPKGKATEKHPTNPRSPYAVSKFAAERYCLTYGYTYNLPITVLRGFNCFGPRQSAAVYGAVIPKFISKVQKNMPPLIFGDGCLPAGQKIIANPKLKQIEALNIGDDVLTSSGFSKVKNTFEKKYDGSLITINGMSILPFKVTEDHPILIKKLKTQCTKTVSRHLHIPKHFCRLQCYCQKYHNHDIDTQLCWVEAKNIKKDGSEFLVMPRIKQEVPLIINLERYIKRPKSAKITKIEVDEDWAYLFGWYLAEGWTDKKQVHFGLGWHEEEKAKKLCNILKKKGFSPSISRRHKQSLDIYFNCLGLVGYIKQHIKTGAKNKKIPKEFLFLPKKEIKSFLNGLFEGDGTIIKKYGITGRVLSSDSIHMMIYAQLMIWKLGFNGGLYSFTDKTGIAWRLQWIEKPRRSRWFKDDNYIYLPIKDISVEKFNGMVYNIETEDNTFCTPAIIHNSQTRDFVYVTDMADGIVRALEKEGIDGEVIHFATGKNHSIKDIANEVIKISGKKIKPEFIKARPGELIRSVGDHSKAKRLLGWGPKVDFDDGLRKTIKWFEEHEKKSTN